MEIATVAELVREFKKVSKRIRRFHENEGGLVNSHPAVELAYSRNTRALFEIERKLNDAGLSVLAVYLRVEHELTVARALTRFTDGVRASNLHRMRRTLTSWLDRLGKVPAVASDDSHGPAAPGLIEGDG